MEKKNNIKYFLKEVVGSRIKKSLKESNKLENTEDLVNHTDEELIDYFLEIKTKDRSIETGKDFEAFFEKIDFVEKTTIKPQYLNKSKNILYKVAAILLPLTVIASIIFYSLRETKTTNYEVISTLKGSKTKIILEDGTTVWLNSDSELKYPSTFSNKEKRIVNLTGEAFFDVTKNEKQPFEVHTAGYKLKVLGTAFNVKAYPGENKMQTTLEHGKVDVEKLSFDDTKPKQIVSLKPKQTIVIYNDDHAIENHEELAIKSSKEISEITTNSIIKKRNILIESEDLSPYLAWKDNKLVFNKVKIIDMVNDLERWYNIDIEIVDESINEKKITAYFTTETVDQAIKAICLAIKIDYEIEKNKVILKAK